MNHKMRADICDPSDEMAVERFRRTLRCFGEQLAGKDWALGVDVYRLRIVEQELIVFCDSCSIDIEGPDDLVRRVLKEYRKAVT